MQSRLGQALLACVATALLLFATGCSTVSSPTAGAGDFQEPAEPPEYVIGPGDTLQIFVWRHEDVSISVPVRPDGRISIPLINSLMASGKTPSQLSGEIQERLANYIKNPLVTVIVTGYVGTFNEQVRVVGAATKPSTLPYRNGMTLLDVMIEVGGLNEFAAGNRATLVRRTEDGGSASIRVRLDDLLNKGDISANVRVMPGDILIIPESFF